MAIEHRAKRKALHHDVREVIGSMSKTLLLRLIAALMVFALVGAACSSGSADTASDTASEVSTDGESDASTDVAPAVDTQAATLTRDLTALLSDHEYLAGLAVLMGATAGPDSPEFKAAAGALDTNSVQLSEAIGSVYGDAGAKKFLSLWRAHIGFFVDYTVGLATKDKAKQAKAVNDLNGYVQAFSGFLSEATGLPRGALRASIAMHVGHLKDQIDAYSAGKYSRAYEVTRHAYAHMFMTGDTLAAAIVKQNPEKFAS